VISVAGIAADRRVDRRRCLREADDQARDGYRALSLVLVSDYSGLQSPPFMKLSYEVFISELFLRTKILMSAVRIFNPSFQLTD
jgi:hypothetical protein